jgi:hypothetical protein
MRAIQGGVRRAFGPPPTRRFLSVFPFIAMNTTKLKKAVADAYRSAEYYPRRKPYSLSPAFDIAVVLFAAVSAVVYFAS